MDIQHLVDRLEDLIDEGRHMPFSRYTMIDEEAALEIIDQMRISIPEEIEKAARILAQRDRVLAQANEEAARILQQARQKGLEMIDQDVSVQAAQNRAANVVEDGHQRAEQIMADADNYVLQVLSQLEQNLIRNLNTVRNGINQVNEAPPQLSREENTPIPAQLPQQETQAEQETVEVETENTASTQAAEQTPPAQPGQGQVRWPSISLKRGGEIVDE